MRQRQPRIRTITGRLWRALRTGLMAMLAIGFVIGPASPASAHAKLLSSAPADGEHLDTPPAEVRLRFDEEVVLVGDGVRLLDASGTTLGVAVVNPADPAEVVLTVPTGLADGVYRVDWRVASDDSHPVEGAFVFSTGGVRAAPLNAAGGGATGDASVAALYWMSRWAGYAGLALLGGGVIFLVLCWAPGWSEPRARRILAVGWLTIMLSAAIGLLLQGPYAAGRPLSAVTDPNLLGAVIGSDFGRYILARIAVLAVTAVLLFWLVRRTRTRTRTRVAEPVALVLAGLALPATWTGTGHANAAGSVVSVVVNVAHVIAMAAWLGGMVFLMACVLAGSPPRPLAEVLAAEERFSRLATAALGTLVVTGGYTSWRALGSLAALPGSTYGALLLFKLAALGLLLWLGIWSRSAVRRRSAVRHQYAIPAGVGRKAHLAPRTAQEELATRTQLRHSIRTEVALGALILALTSALTATARPAAEPPPPAGTQQNG